MAEFLSDEEISRGFKQAGYELIKQKGQGEQGRVFTAKRISISKVFAIKVVVPKDDSFSGKEEKDFLREVICMSLIDSPYVVSVIDQFQIMNKAFCYVMDFIDAPNFKELLEANKFESLLGPDSIIDIFWQVAHGLLVIHGEKIIHRDLKESNILIKKDKLNLFQSIIADFGFGYTFKENDPSPTEIPAKGSSYCLEAKIHGIKTIGIDYYCFSKIIENCINKSNSLKQSTLHKSIKDIIDYLNITSHKVKDISELEEIDKNLIERFADLRKRSTLYRVDPIFAQLLAVPELTDVGDGEVIRLPGQITVPLTKRILKIIDTKSFQRLRLISQLSTVQLVYPGATHSRFEHSIGVFNIARLVLRQLLQAKAIVTEIEKKDIEKLLLAALLHDIGHIPHAHSLEEIKIFNHEKAAKENILKGEIASLIKDDWSTTPEAVVDIITQDIHGRRTDQVLRNILSNAIDIDTMDYLNRDSIHLGVPYGCSFDKDRLIFSLTTNETGDSIAITQKGIVPAETFLISRYAMHSEVYLHHTVRASASMIQRAVWEKTKRIKDKEFIKTLTHWQGSELEFLHFIAGEEESIENKIIGPLAKQERKIYKRFLELPSDVNDALKSLSFSKRILVINHMVNKLKEKPELANLEPWQFLLDIPTDRHQKTNLQVYYEKENIYEDFNKRSPLISSMKAEFEKISSKAQLFIDTSESANKVLNCISKEKLIEEVKTSILEVNKGN